MADLPETLSKELVVEAEAAGLRLDEFVTRSLQRFTKGEVVRGIERRNILLNGRVAKKGLKLRVGDVVTVRDLSYNLVYPNADIPVSCFWQDEALLALNKPAGLPTFPNRGYERDTLANGLIAAYPAQQGIGETPLEAGILHRLDNGTSGLVLVARTQEAFDNLRNQFVERLVEKTYLAIVHGVAQEGGRLQNYLAHDIKQPGRMRVVESTAPGAMYAVTRYKPILQGAQYTLLMVGIRTGVTHQIRCQLARAGMPIIGDALYGTPHAELPYHALHAYHITCKHPTSGSQLNLSARLTDSFRIALNLAQIPLHNLQHTLEMHLTPPDGDCV